MSPDATSPARTSPPLTRQGPSRRAMLGGAIGALALGGSAAGLFAAKVVRANGPVRNVVLVHGAYADGSCWIDVIGHLQEAGLRATAVQNPLTSLADDVAATARILALQDGPTILVGHSWAGTVISEAGTDPKVAGLVYIAARAPDAGEDYGALAGLFETPPASAGLVHAGGFAELSEDAFLRDFAGDVDPARARILYAVQGRVADTLFTSRTKVAAWRTKPSWYAVSKNDRTIAPALQRYMAARMSAHAIELESSHLSPISRPRDVAALIIRATSVAT